MQNIVSIAEMRAACDALSRGSGRSLGFVPTMGALHEGHLALVRLAKEQCDAVAVSIFVNPQQFGPNEDFGAYPRNPQRDAELLRELTVDLLFLPTAEEIYPAGFATFVTVEGLSERLCGQSRPGHFRGVTTVVARLFNIVQPHKAFFGQKDAAQVAIIRKMVADLGFPVEIVVGPIVREADGLAMSSRNAYLSADDRRCATVLHRALRRVEDMATQGVTASSALMAAAATTFAQEPAARVDYISVVDPQTLLPVEDVSGGALVAVAAFLGSTRLIDNVLLGAARVE